jgi:hypothetical protein
MAWSGTSKAGLVLGAVLPVCTYVYTEQQKQQDTRRQEYAAQAEALAQQHEQEGRRDVDTAQALLQQIGSYGSGESQRLCAYVYSASELLLQGGYSPRTSAVLVSALSYVPEDTADAQLLPRICRCPKTLVQMLDRWGPTSGKQIDARLSAPVVLALGRAQQQCPALPLVAAAEAAENQAPPAPPAPPPAAAAGTRCAAENLGRPAATVRVYLQIADEGQRDKAERLRRLLTDAGYLVPGIERVEARTAPAQAQLRYVYEEDQTELVRLAGNLQQLRAACGAQPEFVRTGPLSRYRGKVIHNTFELWFPGAGAALADARHQP